MGKVVEAVTDVGSTILGKDTKAQKEAKAAQEAAQTAATPALRLSGTACAECVTPDGSYGQAY